MGIDLFHWECFQSRGVNPENSADEACFHSFCIFRWIVKFIPRARCAPRARKNSKKNHLTDKVSSSTSVVVQSLVAQLKVKRFPIGRSMVRTLPRVLVFSFFFCVLFFLSASKVLRKFFESSFFLIALQLTRARNNFPLIMNFFLNKVYDDGLGLGGGISVK